MTMQKHKFFLSSLRLQGTEIYLESIKSSWGESDSIINEIETNGFYDEDESLNYWLYICDIQEKDSVVIDVGAYSGLYSILAVKRSHFIKSFALEASSVTYGRLVKNLFINNIENRVMAARYAAWNSEGYVDLKHKFGIYTTCSGDSVLDTLAVDHVEPTPSVTIDSLVSSVEFRPGILNTKSSFIGDITDICGIKIDVEGGEYEVLCGADIVLENFRPIILLEVLSDKLFIKLQSMASKYSYIIERIKNERNCMMIPSEREASFKEGYSIWRTKNREDDSLTMERKLIFQV